MEEKHVERKEVDNVIHHFYCDKCKKSLGETIEQEHSYIPNPKGMIEYNRGLRIGMEWYSINMDLCEDCARELDNCLIETLTQFGFRINKTPYKSLFPT